jgi:hypothetical protein
VKVFLIFLSVNQLKSEFNMAAKLWIHVELVAYFISFPYHLFVENELCLFLKDENQPKSSQRTFDEYQPAEELS